jgi:hypothetical protein
MPLSEKNGDNSGSTLSANAAVGENGDNSGSTLSTNAAVRENGEITGSTLSTNAAVREKTETILLVAYHLQMPQSVWLSRYI